MKKIKTTSRIFLCIATASLMLAGSAQAQTVGTIGVGDINYKVASSDEPVLAKETVLSTIEEGLNKALHQTRKFSILDYDQLTARLEKQGLNLGDYYSKNYAGTEYSQAGLDYILTADITELGVHEQKRGKSKMATAIVDLDFKLIGVADITSDIVSSVAAQASTRISADDVNTDEVILDQAIQKAVDQMVDQVISGLFPIRVMQISESGQIKLNYGEGVLAAGDTVLVYPLGEKVVVDESGEAIGNSVATLQIIDTERKFSNAQALTGFEALKKGQQGKLLLNGG